MCWLKRDIWKAGVVIAGLLLLLVFMVWVPVSAAGAYERALGLAGPVAITVQATPTEDATVTELNKEKLAQEVKQLKNQNEPDLLGWLRTNASILLSTLVVVIGALIGLFRWFGDRRSEREKRAEERFQSIVVGLGDEKEGAKIGAAILLRTFLRPGHEQFYTQTFDLAVANLRLRRNSTPPEDPDGISHPAEDTNTPLQLTTLRQALIVVFKEVFPHVRDSNSGVKEEAVQSLDATGIRLDNAYLGGADLKQVWMPQASLRGADLIAAKLSFADLTEADLSEARLYGTVLIKADLSSAKLSNANLNFAFLSEANLRGANLRGADLYKAYLSGAKFSEVDLGEGQFSGAKLSFADLSGAILSGAKLGRATLSGAKLGRATLSGANLFDADLSGADLRGAILSSAKLGGAVLSSAVLSSAKLGGAVLSSAKLGGAVLSNAVLSSAKLGGAVLSSAFLWKATLSRVDLRGADLSGANLTEASLSETNLEDALSVKDTNLHGVKGLTKEQLVICKARGAIIDEDSMASPPQSTVSPPLPSQSNDAQAASAPPAQASTPTPDTDNSSTTSSQPSTESRRKPAD